MPKNLIPNLGRYIYLTGVGLCIVSFFLLIAGSTLSLDSSIVDTNNLLILLCLITPLMQLAGLLLMWKQLFPTKSTTAESQTKADRICVITVFILTIILTISVLRTHAPTHLHEVDYKLSYPQDGNAA